MTEREKMIRGELYDPSDPELAALLVRSRKLARRYNLTDEDDTEKREKILRELLPEYMSGCMSGTYRKQCTDRSECHSGNADASAAS